MKRCPECRRDYYDDTLLYCLDDGNALLEGPGDGESKTEIFPGAPFPNDEKAGRPAHGADEIGRNFGHFHHAAYNIASAYALLNKPEKAVEWLQLAADDGFPCYPLFDSDPNLKNLRQDARFVAFMAKLKQQWERYNATL